MSTQHTPGPWYVGLIPSEQMTVSSHGFKHKAFPISGSGRAIGCVYNGDARPERRVFADPTPEANARLIAAAPELLAALREVTRLVSELQPVCDCGGEQTGSPEQSGKHNYDCAIGIILDARAAIAKAEQS